MRPARSPGEAEHRAPGMRVPPWTTEPGEGRNHDDTAAVMNRRRQLGHLGRFGDEAEAIAEPLHGGSGHEDRALVGVGGVRTAGSGKGPGHRGEQTVGRFRTDRAHVHEDETAGAVGVLRRSRFVTALAEERGLLIAGHTGDRDAAAQRTVGAGDAEDAARREDLR